MTGSWPPRPVEHQTHTFRHGPSLGPDISPLAFIGGPPEHRDYRRSPETWIPPVIDPTAIIEPFATVDCGTFRSTRIGASWIFRHAHIGHDVLVGDRVEVSTGAIIGGESVIHDGARIGLNATTKPKVEIGPGARLAAGSMLTRNIPAGEVWCGSPAEPIERFLQRRRVVDSILKSGIDLELWEAWAIANLDEDACRLLAAVRAKNDRAAGDPTCVSCEGIGTVYPAPDALALKCEACGGTGRRP